MKRFIVLLFPLLLAACCDTTTVLGSCPIPAELDYVANGPQALPVQDTDPKVVVEDDMRQHAAHRNLSNDFNALHDYVRDKCAS